MSDSGDSADAEAANKEKLYETKNESKKKLIRLLTVMAYVSSVSMTAVLLSLYYIFLWDPKVPQHLRQGSQAPQDSYPHAEHLRTDVNEPHIFFDPPGMDSYWIQPRPPISSLNLVSTDSRSEKRDTGEKRDMEDLLHNIMEMTTSQTSLELTESPSDPSEVSLNSGDRLWTLSDLIRPGIAITEPEATTRAASQKTISRHHQDESRTATANPAPNFVDRTVGSPDSEFSVLSTSENRLITEIPSYESSTSD